MMNQYDLLNPQPLVRPGLPQVGDWIRDKYSSPTAIPFQVRLVTVNERDEFTFYSIMHQEGGNTYPYDVCHNRYVMDGNDCRSVFFHGLEGDGYNHLSIVEWPI